MSQKETNPFLDAHIEAYKIQKVQIERLESEISDLINITNQHKDIIDKISPYLMNAIETFNEMKLDNSEK